MRSPKSLSILVLGVLMEPEFCISFCFWFSTISVP